MRRVSMPSALLASLLLGACSENSLPPTIETTTFAPALGVDLATSTKTASGVYTRDLAAGTGPAVTNGQQLSMRYTGWLANGTRFDGNEAGGPLFTFPLGTGAVIEGWDKGILGMKVGGRRQLIIPSALGYGANGSGPIPGNAILVFNVEVVSAQ